MKGLIRLFKDFYRLGTLYTEHNSKLCCQLFSNLYFNLSYMQGSHSTWKTWKNEKTPEKTWKYHGILKNLINIMENDMKPGKNLVATKNSPLTPLKQYIIH